MDSWIILAGVVAPLCFALVNLSDTYLVKHVAPVKALFVFSGLFAFVVAFVFLILSFYSGSTNALNLTDILVLLVAGVLEFIWIWFYLKALDNRNVPVSSVVPFFQLIGVFAYFGGIVFFNEVFTPDKITAIALVLLGGGLLAVDFRNFSIHLREIGYMALAAFIIAFGTLFFKSVAFENIEFFSIGMFWMSMGMGLTALIIYLTSPSFRISLHEMMHERKKSLSAIILNVSNETMGAIGLAAVLFAALVAPVAKVYAFGSTQYLFVFLLSLIGTHFLPKVFQEDYSWKSLLPKFLAITLMVVGGIILEF